MFSNVRKHRHQRVVLTVLQQHDGVRSEPGGGAGVGRTAERGDRDHHHWQHPGDHGSPHHQEAEDCHQLFRDVFGHCRLVGGDTGDATGS